MAKKRITVDSVVNPLEGSAFFILPSPDLEDEAQTDVSEAPVVQESGEETESAHDLAAATNDETKEVFESLIIQDNDEQTEVPEALNAQELDSEAEPDEASADTEIEEEESSTVEGEQQIQEIEVSEDSTGTPPPRRVGRPNKYRYTKRHSFEFFADQLTDLRMLQAHYELIEGRKVKLSDLVREALDTYLQANGHSNPVFRPEE